LTGRSTLLAVAGLVLLLLPSAQARPLAVLEASELAVASGQLDAELTVLGWMAPAPPTAPLSTGPALVELPGFSIAAARIDVAVHHSQRLGAQEVPGDPPTRWTQTTVLATGATGDAGDARLVALPAAAGSARLSVDQAPLRILPAPDRLDYPSRVGRAADSHVETGSALQVEAVADGLLRVTGSFRLIVDGLDFRLASTEGVRDVHTRTDVDGPEAQVMRTSYALHSTVHEAVLDLEDATVVLPATLAIVPSASVAGVGTWTFQEPSGEVETSTGSQPVERSLVVEGALAADLRRDGHRIAATLDGSASRLLLDGHLTAAAVPTPAAVGAWPAAALAAGLLAAAGLHVALGRRRFARLDRLMDRSAYEEALALAGRFRLHPGLRPDATLAAALCLTALGKPQEARATLHARPWRPAKRALRDFVLARAEALLGARESATRHLAASLMADPRLIEEARADPALSSLMPTESLGSQRAYA
jgi:hypothetical protein